MFRLIVCCIAVVICCAPSVGRSDATKSGVASNAGADLLFEDESRTMAYTVHTAQNQHDEALKVAEQAILAKPQNRDWRWKAANAAEMAGKGNRALAHWLYLVELGDGSARQSALRLCRAMNELPVRRYLLEGLLLSGGADQELLKEYLTVSESLGVTNEAYELLASGLTTANQEVLLKEQARLAEQLGRSAEAVNALNKLALIRPLTPDETVQRAKLSFGQGDLEQAWQAHHGSDPDTERQTVAIQEDFPHTVQQEAAGVNLTANGQTLAGYSRERLNYSWSRPSQQQQERRYLLLERPAVGAMLSYEFNQDVRTSLGVKSTDKSQTMTERLDLASKGYLYHPALLQFKLKFSPEFRQTTQSASEITGTASAADNSFSPNYQVNFVVLGRKPYTVTLFAQHLETQSWATYTGLLQTSSDTYGAELTLKYQLLPTTIGYSSNRSDQNGYWGTSNRWQELHLISRNRSSNVDSSLMATYSVNKQVTNGQGYDITTLHTTLSNQFRLTTDDRISLASTVQYLNQDSSTLQNDSLLINEQLTWQHLKHLQSRYAFNYRRHETDLTGNRWTSFDARLTHKLYENLTTTIGATGSLNSYTGGQEKALTNLLDTTYQRNLGTSGTIQLHAGITNLYTARDGQAGVLQVSNEAHTLTSATETFFEHADVTVSSIVVTNSAGTVVYIRDIDYQINLIGSSVRISRLPLGTIGDGQLVLVSYSYTRDAGFDDTLLTQNYGVMLELKRALFLNYRYLQARQKVLDGPVPARLSDAEIHLATIRYDAGWSETGAVYEDTTSSSDVSYRRWELNQALRLRYSSWLQYVLRGYVGKTTYRSSVDVRKNNGLTTILYWLPLHWMKIELEGYLEHVDGTLENTTNRGAKVGLTSSYRLWTARLSFNCGEQYNKFSDYKRTNNQVKFEIVRAVW